MAECVVAEKEKKERVILSESTQTSLDSENEHAPHFAQQHKSTCHSVQMRDSTVRKKERKRKKGKTTQAAKKTSRQ